MKLAPPYDPSGNLLGSIRLDCLLPFLYHNKVGIKKNEDGSTTLEKGDDILVIFLDGVVEGGVLKRICRMFGVSPVDALFYADTAVN